MKKTTYCGFIAIIGRPNVGKSTLLNHLIGQKLSITSRKPQTTRHRLLGIKTSGARQIIYVDTPGLHRKTPHALNKYMNRAASEVIFDMDAIVFVVDATKWYPEDDWILAKLKRTKAPVILAINKVDKIKDKSQLLPRIEEYQTKMNFINIVPISGKHHINLIELEQSIEKLLPENPFFYPSDQITDRTERFLAAEMIREKLTRNLGEELPYVITVDIEIFKLEKGVLHIAAVIYVSKMSQKAIIIGEKGATLKKIGQQARLDMEKLFGHKVFLQTWVKVKEGWADDEKRLRSLGYD